MKIHLSWCLGYATGLMIGFGSPIHDNTICLWIGIILTMAWSYGSMVKEREA